MNDWQKESDDFVFKVSTRLFECLGEDSEYDFYMHAILTMLEAVCVLGDAVYFSATDDEKLEYISAIMRGSWWRKGGGIRREVRLYVDETIARNKALQMEEEGVN